MTDEDLRAKLKPFLEKTGIDSKIISSFLSMCRYKSGTSYGDEQAYEDLNEQISVAESKVEGKEENNRLFYFAIPPNVFEETGIAIKKSCMAKTGWTRVIVEKPFGRDLESCEEILATLSKQFQEDQLFRIDHYLGKEMVQNLLVFRFGNMMFERIWDRESIQCVFLTFKEPFGTEGRGGYFGKKNKIMIMTKTWIL
jgi:glucose-6-phosphate 1-dehydrogenase